MEHSCSKFFGLWIFCTSLYSPTSLSGKNPRNRRTPRPSLRRPGSAKGRVGNSACFGVALNHRPCKGFGRQRQPLPLLFYKRAAAKNQGPFRSLPRFLLKHLPVMTIDRKRRELSILGFGFTALLAGRARRRLRGIRHAITSMACRLQCSAAIVFIAYATRRYLPHDWLMSCFACQIDVYWRITRVVASDFFYYSLSRAEYGPPGGS